MPAQMSAYGTFLQVMQLCGRTLAEVYISRKKSEGLWLLLRLLHRRYMAFRRPRGRERLGHRKLFDSVAVPVLQRCRFSV